MEFSYPRVTPQGHPVEQFEEHVQDHRGDIERIHLSSPKSGELYFEVARFRELAPQDDYLSHKKYLAQRFGPDSVSPAGRDGRRGKARLGLLHLQGRVDLVLAVPADEAAAIA